MPSPINSASSNNAPLVEKTTRSTSAEHARTNTPSSEHRAIHSGRRHGTFSFKSRKSTQISLQQWEQQKRQPYHEYVHQLVGAGWDNLAQLDTYMSTNPGSKGLVVSVVDISNDFELKQWPDMHNESELTSFLSEQSRQDVKVRLYMAETEGSVSPAVIEALGSSLSLDPTFFMWSIHGDKHVFTPARRHRATFQRLGFGVLDTETPSKTDAKKFGVTVYILPDEEGDGFTGQSGTAIPNSRNIRIQLTSLIFL